MKVLNKATIAFLILLFAWAYHVSGLEVPDHPTGRVTDYTNTLSANEISTLNKKLADFEEQTTNQISVLIIPSLEGDNLEDYSIRLADKWKIGQKGKDKGVILLIVKKDRKIRIEVGYGLEAVLPDGLAGSIIRDEIAPLFRKNRFFAGINRGTDAIMKATSPAFRPTTPKVKTAPSSWSLGDIFSLLFIWCFVILSFIVAVKQYRRLRWEKSRGITHLSFWGYSGVGGGGFSGGDFSGDGGDFSGGGGGFGGGGASGDW
jgi:uncharacterized protein